MKNILTITNMLSYMKIIHREISMVLFYQELKTVFQVKKHQGEKESVYSTSSLLLFDTVAFNLWVMTNLGEAYQIFTL